MRMRSPFHRRGGARLAPDHAATLGCLTVGGPVGQVDRGQVAARRSERPSPRCHRGMANICSPTRAPGPWKNRRGGWLRLLRSRRSGGRALRACLPAVAGWSTGASPPTICRRGRRTAWRPTPRRGVRTRRVLRRRQPPTLATHARRWAAVPCGSRSSPSDGINIVVSTIRWCPANASAGLERSSSDTGTGVAGSAPA